MSEAGRHDLDNGQGGESPSGRSFLRLSASLRQDMARTLIITRTDIARLLDGDRLFDAVKEGFIAHSATVPAARGKRHPIHLPGMPGEAAGMVLSPGLIPSIPAYTVKVNAKFPRHPPAIKGVVLLHSLEDGRLLAMLDSSYVTAVRTAAAGAVGADALARPDSETVAIIGCGVQGRIQLEWLTKIRRVRRVLLHDIVEASAKTLQRTAIEELGVEAEIVDGPARAAGAADIVVTATWAKEPLLGHQDVRPGTHITTLGPDGPSECELSGDLIRAARFFADDRWLQVEMGAIGGAGLGDDAIAGEIGDVLSGSIPGRRSADEVTVYGMVGLPFQDLAAAWPVYQAALGAGAGTGVDLLA